jgi:hypothetical protein
MSRMWFVMNTLYLLFPKTDLGSSISVSRFMRLGGDLSAAPVVQLTTRVPAVDAAALGSSLSFEIHLRIGNGLSTLDPTFLDAVSVFEDATASRGFSIRNDSNFVGGMSSFDRAKLGERLSTLNAVELGCSLSVQTFLRVSAFVSVTHGM